MIARIRLLLPSYVGMSLREYPSISLSTTELPGYQVTIYPPVRVKHNHPDPYKKQSIMGEDIIGGWSIIKPVEVLTDHLVGGDQHWWANCMVVDLKNDQVPGGKTQELVVKAAEIVNDILEVLRWRGKQSYIKTIPVEKTGNGYIVGTQFIVEYLDDSFQKLSKESGFGAWGSMQFRLFSGSVTPEVWQQACDDLTNHAEIPLWEALLLDVSAAEADGKAVVAAYSALEVFIRHYVDQAATAAGKDNSFWKWLMDRDKDYDRQPSVSELLDQVLFFVDGRSLKSDASALWQRFMVFKKSRNDLVHRGHTKDLTRNAVFGYINTTRDVINWVLKRNPEISGGEVALVITAPSGPTPELGPEPAPGGSDPEGAAGGNGRQG